MCLCQSVFCVLFLQYHKDNVCYLQWIATQSRSGIPQWPQTTVYLLPRSLTASQSPVVLLEGRGALLSAPSLGIDGGRNPCASPKDLRERGMLEDEIVFIFQRMALLPACIFTLHFGEISERIPMSLLPLGVQCGEIWAPCCLSSMWSICLFANTTFKKRSKISVKFCLMILIMIQIKICPRRLVKYAF